MFVWGPTLYIESLTFPSCKISGKEGKLKEKCDYFSKKYILVIEHLAVFEISILLPTISLC
jgi:hypothetical protein